MVPPWGWVKKCRKHCEHGGRQGDSDEQPVINPIPGHLEKKIKIEENRYKDITHTFSYTTDLDVTLKRAHGSRRYFPENIAYAVSFMETVSINWWNLMKIVTAVFEEADIWCFEAELIGPCFFFNLNV
jgi:hypothetical protein